MNPSDHLSPGLSKEMTFTIENKHTAPHVGSGTVKVFATPWMIAFMEITARTMIDEHLPEGFSTVGTLVNVRHLALARLGDVVRAKVEITAVDGNKVTLAVEVWGGETLIGKGEHGRYVIDVERFLKKVA